MANTIGRSYRAIEDYVNFSVAAYVMPISNIESVKCKRVALTDKTYLELIYEDGVIRYFDASGMSMSAIGIMIGHIIANQPIRYEITDKPTKREVRKLFK